MTDDDRYVSCAVGGWYCTDCTRPTVNPWLHTLLRHTWPLKRWFE